MAERKLKKDKDGVIRSVAGATHEAIRIEIRPSKSESFCGFRTMHPRYDLMIVYRGGKQTLRYKNNRGDGSWSLGGARFWGVILCDTSWDSEWIKRWFGEDL